MTFNGVIALILLYFTESDSFAYVTVVEDRPCRISYFTFGQN